MTQQTQMHSERSTTTRTAAKEAHAGATTPTRRAAGTRPRTVTPEERHAMIAETAYLIAERRGFQGDGALDDWLQAEAEVDARLFRG